MNPNQILISVIDGFDMKPQEVVSLLEGVKAEYYIRMYSPNIPIIPEPAPITLVQTQFPFSQTPKNKTSEDWRWKEEAIQQRVIERKQLAMTPSRKMREKHPDLVYLGTKKDVAPKAPKKKKKYNISEERREQLRNWANTMRSKKGTDKKVASEEPIVKPKPTINIPSQPETNLKDWADTLVMKNKIKQRLYLGLIKLHNKGLFLEDTDQKSFLEIENVGMGCWREFLKLRFDHFAKK